MAARAKAAVLGALAADCATMPLHWIYNTRELAALVRKADKLEAPEFFEPPSCPFYKMPLGELSPYGYEGLGVLTYLSDHNMDGQAFSEFLAHFYKKYDGYLNHNSNTLISNIASGTGWPNCGDPKDFEAGCIVKVIFVVAKYAGSPELDTAVSTAIRVQQNHDDAVSYGLAAAKILEKVVLGSTISEAVDWARGPNGVNPQIQESISKAFREKLENYKDTVKKLGASCSMPGAFLNALICAATAEDYVQAVRMNIMAGGDNCSRSLYFGALLAAQNGINSIPDSWRKRVNNWSELETLTDKIVSFSRS